MGEQVYTLEEENDRIRDEFDRFREDEGGERERLEALSAALKDVRFGFFSFFYVGIFIMDCIDCRNSHR